MIPVLLGAAADAAAWDPLQSARRAAAQGQRALDSGDTTGAIRNLLRAQALSPEDQEISMGLGETLYQAGDFESSRHQYEAIGSDDLSAWRDPALYNAGNAAFDAGELESALDYYTRALLGAEGDPDENLLFNLELTQRLLEQQQEQQQQQDDSGEQDESQEDQQDPSDQDQEQQQQDQQQEQQEEQQQPDEQEQEQSQPQEQEAAEDQPDPAEQPAEEREQQMTPEEAMRLLQALDADEEELRKSIQRRLRGEEKEAEHDW
jgi:Ca-activated chloride channel family protein